MASMIQAQTTSVLLQQRSKVSSLHAPTLFFSEQRRFRCANTQPVRYMKKKPIIVAAISEELDMVKIKTEEVMAKTKLRAALTVRRKHKEDIKDAIANNLEAFSAMIGRHVVLELISTQIDPKTRKPMRSGEVAIKDWCEKRNRNKGEHVVYAVEFMVDRAFGEPGAVTVLNRHQREFFLESIVVEGHGVNWGPIHFACDSWIQSEKDQATKRIFFSNKLT